jgi:putative methyltransferase
VLLYDLLLGQGVRPHGGPERAFVSHARTFRSCAAALLTAHSAAHLSDILPASCRPNSNPNPGQRHVRVNTFLATVAHVLELLRHPPDTWPKEHRQPLTAEIDMHLPDVLAVPGDRAMHEHPLVACGMLVLQSKASCMPAHTLGARSGWHVVDCCAAPGNKTTHVASFVGGSGRVSAFERDQTRCQTLQQTVKRANIAHVGVHRRVRMCNHVKSNSGSNRASCAV